MKRLPIKFIALVLLGLHAFTGNALAEKTQLLVVTNLPNIEKLSKIQIRQIYLQGGIKIPVKPLGFESGDKSRSVFNTKIIGLTESRIESYWAQMKFTGRASPPKEFSSIEDMLTFLDGNPGHIAYLPSDANIPDSLNIVYSLEY